MAGEISKSRSRAKSRTQCENPHALVHPPQVNCAKFFNFSCAKGSQKSSLDTHWRRKYTCQQLAPEEHAESLVKTRGGV